MKPVVTWIVLANAHRAYVVANRGPGKELATFEGNLRHAEPASEHSDRAGVGHSIAGSGVAAVKRGDPQQQADMKFAREIVVHLEIALAARKFTRLVIVAGSHMLDLMRNALSRQINDALIADVPKDLSALPIERLEAYFGEMIAAYPARFSGERECANVQTDLTRCRRHRKRQQGNSGLGRRCSELRWPGDIGACHTWRSRCYFPGCRCRVSRRDHDTDTRRGRRSRGQIILDAAVAEADENGGDNVSAFMPHGDASTEIIAHAERIRADLILTGRRGLSQISNLLLGSASQRVNRLAKCACLSVI